MDHFPWSVPPSSRSCLGQLFGSFPVRFAPGPRSKIAPPARSSKSQYPLLPHLLLLFEPTFNLKEHPNSYPNLALAARRHDAIIEEIDVIERIAKQPAVAAHSTDTELRAIFLAVKRTITFRHFLEHLGYSQADTTCHHEDNQPSIDIVSANKVTSRVRHIHISTFAPNPLQAPYFIVTSIGFEASTFAQIPPLLEYFPFQKPVPPDDEYYKFALPTGASSTSSYVDPTIPLPAGTQATDSNGNPDDQGLFALANNMTINLGKIQKTKHDLQQLSGDDIPSIRDFYHGIRIKAPSKLEQSDLQASTDTIDNRIDSSDSTLQLSTDIDNCINDGTSEFTGDVPGIKIATTSPFKLKPVETVSPADFSKFLLPAHTSATGSYVDHKIPLQDGLFPFANHTISDVGRFFMKNLKDLPACGNDPPLLDRCFDFIGGLRFTPKDFFSLLVCTSADNSIGLPPEQGLFSFVNHTQFLTSADL
eukprot:scaffold131908_cov53-Attheya_sp.AAC.1